MIITYANQDIIETLDIEFKISLFMKTWSIEEKKCGLRKIQTPQKTSKYRTIKMLDLAFT